MRNTRYGILAITKLPDGKSVTHTTIPSSSRKKRAFAHLRRLKHSGPTGTTYRMLEEKLQTRDYPFTPYPTPTRK